MTLKEFYDKIEGDFSETVDRMGNEAFTKKFVIRFLDDSSFDLMCDSLEKKDYDEAFRGAHTLKGLSLTLGFSKLAASGSRITEALRCGRYDEAENMIGSVSDEYDKTIAAIKELKL